MPDEHAEQLLIRLGEIGVETVNLNHGRGLSVLPAVHFKDYAETARIISGLDAVVSVDSSVAHLAGTLGVRTFTFMQTAPEWRWGLPPATTTPWYDSMTLIRRRDYKDWPGAVAQVVEHLQGIMK